MQYPAHAWLRPALQLAYLPGSTTTLSDQVAADLLEAFRQEGHLVQAEPDQGTDIILSTACFNEQLPWRAAPLFSVRRAYRLAHTPTVFTLVHITRSAFRQALASLESALAKEPADPADFSYPGLSESAHQVLIEQGRRAGPILSLQRLVQAQAKCFRVLLLVGDDQPERVYHFDLAGAYPFSQAGDADFYRDIVLRMATAVSTRDISQHQVTGSTIPRSTWQGLSTPRAMLDAAAHFGQRGFFTRMIRIADLVSVPAIGDAVAAQYSEGCYATWEPRLQALVATVTGRARPVTKDSITEDDLAVICGVRPDGLGALVRDVEGSQNLPASSEAVEMMAIDSVLPRVQPAAEFGLTDPVPAARSKVHGHRSVDGYDPQLVEYVPLAAPYQHFLVSCGTEAQANGIRDAFSRSQALNNPSDPRQLVFTVLPGHGVVIAEKWAADKAPFQLIWEYMDAGALRVGSRLPQGEIRYVDAGAEMRLAPGCLGEG
ncbi:MAG: hypothetical protein ACYC6L_01415 [Anaerolineae bacterium]